jgi:hypothetical protein
MQARKASFMLSGAAPAEHLPGRIIWPSSPLAGLFAMKKFKVRRRDDTSQSLPCIEGGSRDVPLFPGQNGCLMADGSSQPRAHSRATA